MQKATTTTFHEIEASFFEDQNGVINVTNRTLNSLNHLSEDFVCLWINKSLCFFMLDFKKIFPVLVDEFENFEASCLQQHTLTNRVSFIE